VSNLFRIEIVKVIKVVKVINFIILGYMFSITFYPLLRIFLKFILNIIFILIIKKVLVK
jgi:hypothetical protein